jgi:DNA repair exonuclease SbcCD ATPase subunit
MDLSYELLSGGQKFMIALALRLGLSLIIQQRLGVNIKFLQLDEVDKDLDKAAVDALAALLKKLQDRFKIFVITHNDRLKDKFSHAILIEYHEKDGSKAKVVSSW